MNLNEFIEQEQAINRLTREPADVEVQFYTHVPDVDVSKIPIRLIYDLNGPKLPGFSFYCQLLDDTVAPELLLNVKACVSTIINDIRPRSLLVETEQLISSYKEVMVLEHSDVMRVFRASQNLVTTLGEYNVLSLKYFYDQYCACHSIFVGDEWNVKINPKFLDLVAYYENH